MQVSLQNAGKRFNRDWIFRHVNLTFLPGRSYAITGPNGSGKSTLLQLLAGALQPTEGSVTYSDTSGNTIPDIDMYNHVSLAAPYLELIEELTALEMIAFHSKFKVFRESPDNILKTTGLEAAAAKPIKYFSSGMKQRLKLALAFFSQSDILLLDEPLTNLDAAGAALYDHLIVRDQQQRILIISSNEKKEYAFCSDTINILDLKHA